MRYASLGILFAGGFALLVAGVLFGWLMHGHFSVLVIRALMAGLGVVLAVMLVQAFRGTYTERWVTLLLVGVLLLGFSIFVIFSFGILTLPVAIILLALSVFKLIFSPSYRSAEGNR
jgi:hypothetical protein